MPSPVLPLTVGSAVVVLFGAQAVVGYVIALKDDCPPEMAAKIKQAGQPHPGPESSAMNSTAAEVISEWPRNNAP